VRRGGEAIEIAVAVVERPEDPERFASLVTPERNLVPRLGILGLELDEELRRSLGPLRGRDGVVVAARSGGGAGAEDGLRTGDVVYSVNGVSVRGLAELRSAAGRPAAGEPLVLHVERGGRLVYVVVETE
jgi:S1-C subfamily serine protease